MVSERKKYQLKNKIQWQKIQVYQKMKTNNKLQKQKRQAKYDKSFTSLFNCLLDLFLVCNVL